MLRVTKILPLILALVILSLFASCGNDRSNVRFVHVAVSNPPGSTDVALDVAVDGKAVATALAYGGVSPASGYQSVAGGSRRIQMSTTTTTDDKINSTIGFASGRNYTLLATGFVTLPSGGNANFNIAAVLLTDDNSAPSSGNVKLRFLHAAPYDGVDVANLDIYVVPPGTDISGLAPNVSNLIYGQASAYLSVPAASNEVIVTTAGTKTRAIPDQTLDTFAAGQIRTLVLVNVQNGVVLSPSLVVLSDLN